MDYKNTIITPKTDFPMRAGLPKREPDMLKAWNELDLYHEMYKRNGPPMTSTPGTTPLGCASIPTA